MASELRSRLLTLAVLALLAGGVYLYAKRADLVGQPRPLSGALYPGFDATAVDSLHVTLRDGYDLRFERQPGGRWLITEPTRDEARQELVELILDNLSRAQVEPVEAPGEPLRAEAVGLEPPRHLIRFGVGGREQTLLLGDVEPLGRMLYARRSGDDRIVLATRNLVTVLEGHAGDFVDPALIRGLSGPVTSLLVRDGGEVRLDARRAGGRWMLHLPDPVLADENRVAGLVRSIAFARSERTLEPSVASASAHALGLPDEAERAAGDDRGAMRVSLGTDGAPPVSAWLAAGWRQSGDEYVPAVRAGPSKVLGIPRPALNGLLNEPAFFRERRVLQPVSESARSVRVEQGGETLLDIRQGSDSRWTFHAPERLAGELVESERIAGHSVLSEFLAHIDALEAVDFTAWPGGEPDASLIVGSSRGGGEVIDRVDFVSTPAGVVARSSERLTEGLRIDAQACEPLLEPTLPDRLRSTRAIRVDQEAWSRLVLVSPAAGTRVVERSAAGDWTGDDQWNRGFAIGADLLKGFRGLQWRPAPAGAAAADYRWEVRFEDGQGRTLAALRMREPAGDEEREIWGVPVVRAAVEGYAGVELLVAREWIERLDALARPPQR